MARRLSPHEQLPVTGHLEELRNRIFWCIGAIIVAFTAAMIFRDTLFNVLDRPLGEHRVTTFGVTEPFVTILTVSGYCALIAASPVITYHLYQFVAPALESWQQRRLKPYVVAIPALFMAGAAFGYFVVLGPAVRFLLGVAPESFDVAIRASEYYGFAATTLVSVGALFLFPLIIVAAGAVGLVTAAGLRHSRRYAILLIAVVAALLPTIDPVSMALEMLPLLVLFELSVLLVRAQERSRAREATSDSEQLSPPSDRVAG